MGGPRTKRPWMVALATDATIVTTERGRTGTCAEARAGVTDAQPSIVAHVEPKLWSQPGDDEGRNATGAALAG